MGNPLPTLTPGKLAWLLRLEREGVASRPRGIVGRNCMVNGWTDWVCRLPNGETALWRDLTFEQRREDVEMIGEALTDAGREKLAHARDRGSKPVRAATPESDAVHESPGAASAAIAQKDAQCQ